MEAGHWCLRGIVEWRSSKKKNQRNTAPDFKGARFFTSGGAVGTLNQDFRGESFWEGELGGEKRFFGFFGKCSRA